MRSQSVDEVGWEQGGSGRAMVLLHVQGCLDMKSGRLEAMLYDCLLRCPLHSESPGLLCWQGLCWCVAAAGIFNQSHVVAELSTGRGMLGQA